MLTLVLWSLFFLLFPALVIKFCQRFPIMDKIGALIICYAVGLLLGNMGLVPQSARGLLEPFMSYSVAFALPLLFFSLNIKSWSRLAGVSLLAFLFQTVAVLIAVTVTFFVFRTAVGAETWKSLGMLIGVYVGGTFNMAAIGTALGVEKNLFNTLNLADVVVSAFYMLLVITVLQRLLLKLRLLPAFKSRGAETESFEDFELTEYAGIFSRRHLPDLGKALGLALLVFAVGGGVSMLIPGELSAVVGILLISTLGIACSFIPAVRNLKKSFQMGNYLILIFSLTLSSQADIVKVLTTAPAVIGMVGMVVALCMLIHILLCAIFRIDADTMITTSAAGVMSAPFIPMVASALKNREMIMTGVITGIIGWTIGTYVGVGYAYVLHALLG